MKTQSGGYSTGMAALAAILLFSAVMVIAVGRKLNAATGEQNHGTQR